MVRKTEIFFNHEIEDKVLKALIMQFESLLSLNFWVSRKERGGHYHHKTTEISFSVFCILTSILTK